MNPAWYRWQGRDLILYCHLQPGARQPGFTGIHGERLKIRISAPPVDGRANDELIRFLARAFGVAKSAVHIEQGASGRQKTVRVEAPILTPAPLEIAPNPA